MHWQKTAPLGSTQRGITNIGRRIYTSEKSVVRLRAAIDEFLDIYNDGPFTISALSLKGVKSNSVVYYNIIGHYIDLNKNLT